MDIRQAWRLLEAGGSVIGGEILSDCEFDDTAHMCHANTLDTMALAVAIWYTFSRVCKPLLW